MINTREVASFIDGIIAEIEEKKKYNEVVEKVVKRLIENNLYIKLEKCKWEVREVEFVRVVIGLKKIYYRWFIKYFIFIAKLLYNIVKKDKKIRLDRKVFKKLKKIFIKKLVLMVLDLDKNRNICVRLCNRRDFVNKM